MATITHTDIAVCIIMGCTTSARLECARAKEGFIPMKGRIKNCCSAGLPVFVGKLMRPLELQNGEFMKGLLEVVIDHNLKHFVVGEGCQKDHCILNLAYSSTWWRKLQRRHHCGVAWVQAGHGLKTAVAYLSARLSDVQHLACHSLRRGSLGQNLPWGQSFSCVVTLTFKGGPIDLWSKTEGIGAQRCPNKIKHRSPL